MVCKYEMISEHKNYDVYYKCDKYGFSNPISCNKLNQPNCYEEVNNNG